MKHLVSALPRMALLAAAFVAVTAIWGAGTDATRAEEHDRPGDRGPLSYVMSLAQPGQLPDADAPIAAAINELDGDRYAATLFGSEPAGTMSSPIIGTSSAGSFGAFNNHGRPQVIVSGSSRDGAAVSVIELQDGHGRRYALEASGNLLETRYFEADAADAAEATWSATAPLPKFAAESGSLWGNNLEIAELLRAAFSIEERERVYGGGADAAEGDNGDWIPATVIEFREGYLTFAEENGRYWARLRADEAVITFYESGSSQPAWTAAVPLDDGSDAGALAGVPANMPGAEMLLRAIVANLPDDAKVFHDADTRTYEYVRPMALVPASVRLTMSGATVVVDAASPAGAVIYARFTADLENEYVATVRGTEVEVRFYPRGAGRHAWSAIVQLNEPLEGTDPSLALAPTLIAAIRSITLADLQPPAASGADWSDGAGASAARIGESERTNDGNAAVIAAPDAEQSQAPRQAAPDEGGTGVNNFDREEWYEFSILLAPFLVLVTFILILMFRWDRGSKEE